MYGVKYGMNPGKRYALNTMYMIVYIDDPSITVRLERLQYISKVRVLFIRKILESKSVSLTLVPLECLALFVLAT